MVRGRMNDLTKEIKRKRDNEGEGETETGPKR